MDGPISSIDCMCPPASPTLSSTSTPRPSNLRPWRPSDADADIYGADQNMAPKLGEPIPPNPTLLPIYPPFVGMQMIDQHRSAFLGHLTSHAMTPAQINEMILVHERLRPMSYTSDPVRQAWIEKFKERRKMNPDAEYLVWKERTQTIFGEPDEEDPGDMDWSGEDRAEWMREKEEREIEELAAQHRARIGRVRDLQQRQDRELFVNEMPMPLTDATETVLATGAEVEMVDYLADLPGGVQAETEAGKEEELEEEAEEQFEHDNRWMDNFPALSDPDLAPGGYYDKEICIENNNLGRDANSDKGKKDSSTTNNAEPSDLDRELAPGGYYDKEICIENNNLCRDGNNDSRKNSTKESDKHDFISNPSNTSDNKEPLPYDADREFDPGDMSEVEEEMRKHAAKSSTYKHDPSSLGKESDDKPSTNPSTSTATETQPNPQTPLPRSPSPSHSLNLSSSSSSNPDSDSDESTIFMTRQSLLTRPSAPFVDLGAIAAGTSSDEIPQGVRMVEVYRTMQVDMRFGLGGDREGERMGAGMGGLGGDEVELAMEGIMMGRRRGVRLGLGEGEGKENAREWNLD